ncbi:MAG: hypothetical protein A2268_16625 [Candidatus Raymondbacteria bacterium RifOxyA12_full_50_37]|uniref:Secretion system C-terminal sorting domain-containing protein n=1 Tax=Candidatus Raymondbacteria bacterium RIFOXYD12_FULL_49_13 TaxID=1817890 RepID=A0A1F7F4M6_UNCRA|nr:MAG: hypothetical protein A2268_16625 [Candidatus Raymondbacteria bacterium RifOxyA12_full_50_37]OGJ86235.1 MAG: hypothetical protein A2248_16215 [Candidatus Raymondbacteria bacterium RIFOXYA2_FULL_49_16]OGJ95774.1 MAG: hypothetical protein A2453_11535 [Candidatus Raymondbacteria bacterium RIFOXYC2_FULL_50_21]OGK01466.1 MAG: hypothetical protein A2519_19270 [Candidatus Raymondbacteria bacterium RIFOXYD12_FULL_49_13]OGK03464.1 MAG: hypothetical protein A2350_16020 [Candidatus Raymondbacteria 
MKQAMALIFLVLLSSGVFGAVVLNEPFDTDDGNWNGVLGSTYEISGGTMNISSDTSNSIKWVVRNGLLLKNFIVSVKTEVQALHKDGAIGISLRTQSNGDSYWFLIYPTGFYQVSKYIGMSNTTLYQYVQRNSFVRPDVNRLKIVAEEDTFSFLCNGQLLCRIVDAAIAAEGKIGLNVLGATVAFDSMLVDDTPVPSHGLSSFADDFSDTSLFGWAQFDTTGSFSVVSNKLRAVGDAQGYMGMLHTSGNYGTDDTIEVTATKASVGTAYNYGLMFHFDDNLNEGYIFLIIDGQGYSLSKLDNGHADTLFTPAISFDINTTTNTLKVISSASGEMKLYINGVFQRTVTDHTFPSGSSGIMVANNITIDFDNFRVSGQAPTATEDGPAIASISDGSQITTVPNPFNPSVTIAVSGQQTAGSDNARIEIFNIHGKHVQSLPTANRSVSGGSVGVVWDASAQPSGVYIVKVGMGNRMLTKAITLVK